MLTYKQRQAGFTIVELLIVIVVIAILATITVVAYTGIQERARVSGIQSSLKDISQILAIYGIDNSGVYPTSVGQVQASGIDRALPPDYAGTTNALYCGAADGYTVFMRLGTGAATREFKIGSETSLTEVIPIVSWSAATLCATTPHSYALWAASW